MWQSIQNWRNWGHNEFYKHQARLEEIRHTEFNTEQDWKERGIVNFTDSKQDWRKWGTLNFTKSQHSLNIWGILNLTENMGRETEAYWIWNSKQDWRNWDILHLTSRLFTTNTHKATLGSDGPWEKYDLPSHNLVFKEKILNSVTSTEHMNTTQKQEGWKKQMHTLQITFI